MKLLEHAHSKERAREILGLLRDKGIPTFTKFAGSPYIGPNQLAIFVCLDQQYGDARALLRDPAHTVASPVDVAEFNQLMEKADYSAVLKWGAVLLAAVVAALVAYVYLSGVPLLGA